MEYFHINEKQRLLHTPCFTILLEAKNQILVRVSVSTVVQNLYEEELIYTILGNNSGKTSKRPWETTVMESHVCKI